MVFKKNLDRQMDIEAMLWGPVSTEWWWCENFDRKSNLLSEPIKINIWFCGKECFCWCSDFPHPVQGTFCTVRFPLLSSKSNRLMVKTAGQLAWFFWVWIC